MNSQPLPVKRGGGEGLAPPSSLVSIDFPSGEGEACEEDEAEELESAAIFLSDSLGRNAENREGTLGEGRLAPPPPPFATDFLLEEGAADEEDEAEARSLVLAPVIPWFPTLEAVRAAMKAALTAAA
jgi:hypothetical protein